MQVLNIPTQIDVLEFTETGDFDLAASFLGFPKEKLKFVTTMHKEQDVPKILNGVVIEDFLKQTVLQLYQPFRIIRIALKHYLVMEFSIGDDIDQAYGKIMDELMRRKQALCSFPLEWYDFGSNTFKLVLTVLHD